MLSDLLKFKNYENLTKLYSFVYCNYMHRLFLLLNYFNESEERLKYFLMHSMESKFIIYIDLDLGWQISIILEQIFKITD